MPTLAIIDGVKIQFFADELPAAKMERIPAWATTHGDVLMAAWTALANGRKPEPFDE